MSTSNQQADTTRTNVAQGSSTGAPGAPLSTQDTRSQYDPATTGYNSATGAGYSTSSAGGPHHHHHQPPSPPNDYDRGGQDDRIQYAPSTAQRVQMEDEAKTGSTASGQKDATTGPWSARASEQAGRKAKGVMASVHGAGESLRGGLTAAVDRAFGSNEGAERNEEIARRGEREIRKGEYSSGGAPRESK